MVPSPPPLLVSTGVGEVLEGEGFCNCFLLSLASALFTSERLRPTSDCVQYLLVPFLDARDPPTPFLGSKASREEGSILCQGGEARGSG